MRGRLPKVPMGGWGHHVSICLTPFREPHLSPDFFFKKNIDTSRWVHISASYILIVLGVNGVAVARYGLILSEDGATGSRKVFRCLLGLWYAT